MKAEEIGEVIKRKLFIGKKIKALHYAEDKYGKTVLRRARKGTVTGIYPYIFTVVFDGGYTESFRYSQFWETKGDVVRL